MSLREMLSDYWCAFQQELFPRLEGELGPMGERYELFVAVLELVRVEAPLPYFRGQVGRPEEDRAALARAFIAKAVFDIPTTRALTKRLEVDGRLWRLCGWSGGGRLPSDPFGVRAAVRLPISTEPSSAWRLFRLLRRCDAVAHVAVACEEPLQGAGRDVRFAREHLDRARRRVSPTICRSTASSANARSKVVLLESAWPCTPAA